MNNLYHKVAVASVCTVLGFALGANTEAKAATLSLEPTIKVEVADYLPPASDGLGDAFVIGGGGTALKGIYSPTGKGAEIATLTEFNIGTFSFAPNSISRAIIQTGFYFWVFGFGITDPISNPGSLGIFGYVGNGTAEVSDFEAGVFLSSIDISSLSTRDTLNFDVTSFVNQRVNNGDAFAGFGIRALNFGAVQLTSNDSRAPLKLIVETGAVAEPVPEPTTIFGSAIGLYLGGWLKRKKSSQPKKTARQD
ncbi:MAG TPA: PEP-CTERM sorting domain-containing protein [Candidatus Sericytochromatia bacterium]